MIARVFFLALLVGWISNPVELQAQTYATPELREAEEKHFAEKNKRLGITEVELTNEVVDQTEKSNLNVEAIQSNPAFYKLTAVNVIDREERHHATEMQDFKRQAQEEFDKSNLVVDWENQLWYHLPRNIDKSPVTRKFHIENGYLQFDNCLKCQDSRFAISSHTPENLSVEIASQDEGHYFVFQFVFTK